MQVLNIFSKDPSDPFGLYINCFSIKATSKRLKNNVDSNMAFIIKNLIS